MIVLVRKRLLIFLGSMLLFGVLIWGIYLSSTDKPVTAPIDDLKEPKVIVLDAGHGGEDGGAVSASGVPESDINLEIAQKAQWIFSYLGYQTAMTRAGKDAVYSDNADTLHEKKVSDLNNRVQTVNSLPNSFLISIHQNSLPSKATVHGAQVFYNQIEPSRQAAESVQIALNRTINTGNEKNAKQMDGAIYLMKKIQRPGILIECGFMSNAVEVELLQTNTHQLCLAAAIIAGYTAQ